MNRCAGEVADQRGDDDHRAAHGRRAPLGQVRLRARRPGSPGRSPAGGTAGSPAACRGSRRAATTSAATRTDLTKRAPTGSASASATRSRPAARLAFTSTTSSGRSCARSSAMAASASARAQLLHAPRGVRSVAPPGPTTTTRSTPSSAVELADAPVLVGRGRPELGHLAEHRPGPPAPGHRGQRPQRGGHRLRVGVVGVVDDEHAVRPLGDLHPPPATAARPRPSAAATAGSGMPSSSATAAAASELPTWCSPCTASVTGTRPGRRSPAVNEGVPRVVQGHVHGADVGGRRPARR